MKTDLSSRAVTSVIWLGAVAMAPLVGHTASHEKGAKTLQDEIVVTARRREESLLEIPIAVTTLNQNEIIERGILDTESLSAYTPGFTLQNQGTGGAAGRQNPNIRFRGLAVQQDNPAARAGAIFWDGAYISDGVGVIQLIDLERVEVIKGPQQAFFGRNTFSGAVNYIPRRPGEELEGRLVTSYAPDSDGDSYEVTGAIGGPLGESFGFRAALSQLKRGADYEYRDGSPLGEEETTSFWGMLTFSPNDQLDLRLSSFAVESEDTRQLSSQEGQVAPGQCNRSYSGSLRRVGTGENLGSFTTDLSQSTLNLFCGQIPDWDERSFRTSLTGRPDANTPTGFGAAPFSSTAVVPVELQGEDIVDPPDGLGATYEVWRVHFAGDYEFSNGFVLGGFVSHGESSSWGRLDGTFGTQDPRFGGFLNKVEDTSYELRISSQQDRRLRWTLGVNYYEQDTIGTNYPNFAIGPVPPPNMLVQEGDNLGIFGSIDFDITDQLTASFEGRWTDDSQTIIFEGPSGGTARVAGETAEYDKFAPRVILSWQPTDDINIYGSYSKSYLQGIQSDAAEYAIEEPNSGIDPSTVGFFTPTQELDAFEIGLKQSIGLLDYSIAVYYMDWQNQTFFDLSPPPVFASVNIAGDAEYSGVEVEWTANITDWFRFMGGFNYVDAEFTEFGGTGSVARAVLAPGLVVGGTQIDAAGLRPRYVPETTGVFSFDFNFPILGFDTYARADALWTGSFYVDNFEYNEVDGYWRLNLRGGVEFTDEVRAEIYGLNVTDDQSWITAGGTTSGIPGSRTTFGQPPQQREVGVRLIVNF